MEPGFVNDLFSAFYPFAFVSPAITSLHLEEYGLRWCRAPLVLAHPAADGTCPVLSTDLDETAASLDACHPGDGDAWRRLHDRWTRLRDPVARRAVHADSTDRGERAARGVGVVRRLGTGRPVRAAVGAAHGRGGVRFRRGAPAAGGVGVARRSLARGGAGRFLRVGVVRARARRRLAGPRGRLRVSSPPRSWPGSGRDGGEVVCDSPVERVVMRDRRARSRCGRGATRSARASRARRRRRAVVVPRPRRCRAPLGEGGRRRAPLRVGQRDGQGRLESRSTDSVVVGAGTTRRHVAPGRQCRLADRVDFGAGPRARSRRRRS